MFTRLKQCKNLKEIQETIPEAYYERGSFVMIHLMLFMIVAETAARYITRHQTFNEMIRYFYYVGYIVIAFAVIIVVIQSAGRGMTGIKEHFKKNPYDGVLLVMLLWSLISVLSSEDIKTAFMGNWFRQSGFRTYLIYASMYICGKNIKKQSVRLYIYLSFALAATVQNMLLITRHLGYYGSKAGAFYNPNHSGYFLTMAIMAIVGLISLECRMYIKVIGVLMYILNVWCLIINDTFGCYLAVAAGLVFLSGILLVKNKKLNRMVVLSMLLFIAVSGWTDYKTDIISKNFGVTTKDIGKIANGSEDAGGAGTGRWELWVNAAKYMLQSPVLGCGPDCLTGIQKQQLDKDAGEGNLSEPHNEYLQYAAEIGIPGAVCYVAALIMICIYNGKAIKKTEDSRIYNGAVVFAYCVSAFFGVIMFYTAVFFFFFLGMSSTRHA